MGHHILNRLFIRKLPGNDSGFVQVGKECFPVVELLL
jgi:hypothetical protein